MTLTSGAQGRFSHSRSRYAYSSSRLQFIVQLGCDGGNDNLDLLMIPIAEQAKPMMRFIYGYYRYLFMELGELIYSANVGYPSTQAKRRRS